MCRANSCNQKWTVLVPRVPVSKKCWLQTADRIQNVDEVQSVDSRLQIGYKMQTEDLKSFFVWFVITCHLTTYRASRNYFSAVSFHDYLHYFEIFLGHFLMKIDRTIISNLHSLLTLRASWLVWCLYRFYQRNKSRCRCKREVTIEYLTRATFEKQLTAFTWSVLSSF